jgi:hypothetical protein
MFIKFAPYTKKSGVVVLRAAIVRAFRDAVTGSPRQQHILTVQSVPALALADQSTQLAFWASLENALSRLRITETDRENIRRSALKRVPRPVALGASA